MKFILLLLLFIPYYLCAANSIKVGKAQYVLDPNQVNLKINYNLFGDKSLEISFPYVDFSKGAKEVEEFKQSFIYYYYSYITQSTVYSRKYYEEVLAELEEVLNKAKKNRSPVFFDLDIYQKVAKKWDWGYVDDDTKTGHRSKRPIMFVSIKGLKKKLHLEITKRQILLKKIDDMDIK